MSVIPFPKKQFIYQCIRKSLISYIKFISLPSKNNIVSCTCIKIFFKLNYFRWNTKLLQQFLSFWSLNRLQLSPKKHPISKFFFRFRQFRLTDELEKFALFERQAVKTFSYIKFLLLLQENFNKQVKNVFPKIETH